MAKEESGNEYVPQCGECVDGRGAGAGGGGIEAGCESGRKGAAEEAAASAQLKGFRKGVVGGPSPAMTAAGT